MKISAQLSAAIQVLQQVLMHHVPAQKALEAWGKEHRFAGSSDRAQIGNLVYDVLRSKASLAHIMGKDSPRALVMALYATQWASLPLLEAMLLEKQQHAPTPLTEKEIACLEAAETTLKDAPLHVRANFPEWMEEALVTAYGDATFEIMHAQTARAPVDIRVNEIKTNISDLKHELSHLNVTPCPISPNGLRIAPPAGKVKAPHLEAEHSFHKGWFEVQDEGSQLVSMLCGAKPNDIVLDYCAGGGGKTLALASYMHNQGQIYAYDEDRLRLAGLYPRLERSGASNVFPVDPKRPDILETLKSLTDLVVIDAPCTGTGTWRRKPDSKWRISEKQVRVRMREQAEVLDEACSFVKKGGVLVYITCSLLPQENAEQIGFFLERHKEFSALSFKDHLDMATYKQLDAHLGLGDKTSLSILPSIHKTDGFFIALLKRD